MAFEKTVFALSHNYCTLENNNSRIVDSPNLLPTCHRPEEPAVYESWAGASAVV